MILVQISMMCDKPKEDMLCNYQSNKMLQWWPVTSSGSLSKCFALRGDLNIEDGSTTYWGRLVIPHKLGVVMDTVHKGHLERSRGRYLREMQDNDIK